MDTAITSAISNMQQAEGASAIQVRVAQKVLDAQRQEGAAALELLNAAKIPGPGDRASARATGLGGQMDAYA